MFLFSYILFMYCFGVFIFFLSLAVIFSFFLFFFTHKTAYEMRISDWSSDVCSSDLSPDEDDGARDRKREAEDEALARSPPQRPRQGHAEERCYRDLDHGPGDGDVLHREQISQREMQADAEHQKDHPDLG